MRRFATSFLITGFAIALMASIPSLGIVAADCEASYGCEQPSDTLPNDTTLDTVPVDTVVDTLPQDTVVVTTVPVTVAPTTTVVVATDLGTTTTTAAPTVVTTSLPRTGMSLTIAVYAAIAAAGGVIVLRSARRKNA